MTKSVLLLSRNKLLNLQIITEYATYLIGKVGFISMFVRYDPSRGIPPRIYRTVGEIRRDIRDISQKIADADKMMNIRSLLIDILASDRYDDPRAMIPELYDAIAEANDALKGLKALNEELDALREELNETKCEIGM